MFCLPAKAEEFKFTYIFGHDKLEYKTNAVDWDHAMSRGADFCNDFFVKKEKTFSEERRLEIINTCANPNSTHNWD